MADRAVNKDTVAKVVNIAPDVCLTPMGSATVLVAYNISCTFEVAEDTAPGVNYGGTPAFTMASRLPRVTGNELGTGGGIVSGVNRGYCRPVQHSGSVNAHNAAIVRHDDLMSMNCNGPNGAANTYGRITYINVLPAAPSKIVLYVSEPRVTKDPETGETTVEEREISRDPETGQITETTRRTVIDPQSGSIETQSLSISEDPLTGERSYLAETSNFDPNSNNYSWETDTGALPPAEGSSGYSSNLNIEGQVLDSDSIGTVDGQGRTYLGDGMWSEPPNNNLINDLNIADDDPELLADPDYQAALGEEAAAQAEANAIDYELALMAAETTADVAGIFDPSPASDTAAGLFALRRRDYISVGLSLLSWFPYIGDVIAKPLKGSRIAAKTAKLLQKLKKLKARLSKLKDKVEKTKERVKQALKKKREGAAPPKKGAGDAGDGGHVPDKKKKKKDDDKPCPPHDWKKLASCTPEASKANLRSMAKKLENKPSKAAQMRGYLFEIEAIDANMDILDIEECGTEYICKKCGQKREVDISGKDRLAEAKSRTYDGVKKKGKQTSDLKDIQEQHFDASQKPLAKLDGLKEDILKSKKKYEQRGWDTEVLPLDGQ